MPADGSGTDLKHGGSSLPDLTNFKIEPNPSANNFVHMSGGTCSTIKVEEPDQGSPYSSVRKSYNYYFGCVIQKRTVCARNHSSEKKRFGLKNMFFFFRFSLLTSFGFTQ